VKIYLTWPTGPKLPDACGKLVEFKGKITTEMAKPRPGMTAAQAASLTAYANQVAAVIPCS
jgi:hypothetical protein